MTIFWLQFATTSQQMLRQRSAAVRYAIARRQRQILRDTDAVVLEWHRARFRERHQHARGTDGVAGGA